MRGLISHLRYTVRLLLKSPGFTITTVLILGLGVGANTAIFSLVNGVLLKPLPYPHADRLVSIYEIIHDFDKAQLDYPDYIDLRKTQQTFAGVTAYYPDDFTITGSGEPERISGLYASGSLFKVLSRPFLLGAPFGETEDGCCWFGSRTCWGIGFCSFHPGSALSGTEHRSTHIDSSRPCSFANSPDGLPAACATSNPGRSNQGATGMKKKFHHKDTKNTKVGGFVWVESLCNSVFATFVSLW
jgi:hypothetical protein